MSLPQDQLTKLELLAISIASASLTGMDFISEVLATPYSQTAEYCAQGIESCQRVAIPLLVGLTVYGFARERIIRYQTKNTDDKSPHSRG